MADEGDKNIKTDGQALFRREMKRMGARPIRHRKRATGPSPRRRASAVFKRQDEQAVLNEMLGAGGEQPVVHDDEDSYQRQGIPRRTLRRLRRGQISVQDELDLHGLRIHQARDALAEFLADCRTRRLSCVRIIHGKGLGSGPSGPVLRPKVRQWLMKRNHVLAFCSAPAHDGGSGALYVLLKNR